VRSVFDGGDGTLREWGERHRDLVTRYTVGAAP
jgi:hypothetical protein